MKYHVYMVGVEESVDIESFNLSFTEMFDDIRDFILDPDLKEINIRKVKTRRNEKND